MSDLTKSEATRLAMRDNDAWEETKAKWANWLWRLYTTEDEALATAAMDNLIAAVRSQHASGRALVHEVAPRRRPLTMRPLSPDERE